MTPQQVSAAVLPLQDLSAHARGLSQQASRRPGETDDIEDAIDMAAALDSATLYLVDYLGHLDAGLDSYDALRAAARGDLPPSGGT